MTDAVVNVMQPFLLEGVLFNRWDNYYANLEAEIAELTTEIRLDELSKRFYISKYYNLFYLCIVLLSLHLIILSSSCQKFKSKFHPFDIFCLIFS